MVYSEKNLNYFGHLYTTIWVQKIKTKIKMLWVQIKRPVLVLWYHLREWWLTQARIVLGSCGQLSCAGGHWSSSGFAVVLFHWAVMVQPQRFHHKHWRETLGEVLHSGLVTGSLLMSSSVVRLKFKNLWGTAPETALVLCCLARPVPCYPMPSFLSLLPFVFVQQGWCYFSGIPADDVEKLSTCCALKCTWNPSCSYSLGSGF